MIVGTIYGVALNDAEEIERLRTSFSAAPYNAPPLSPIVYIKPRMCATTFGAAIPLPKDESELKLAATVALTIGRDASRVEAGKAMHHVASAGLALDVAIPFESYYRPPVANIARDGFLPLGATGAVGIPDEIVTAIDDLDVHCWKLSRLVRSPAQLIADLSQFMTLRAGDLILVGLPGDAPRARLGQRIRVTAHGMAQLTTLIATENAL
ncbi:MAG: fumarylacetoacetate hydrolase family protein [Caulobacterales bacterium]|nr:fumarylacetoacetate hydrolase family protein [Caulobacterales bacterium]